MTPPASTSVVSHDLTLSHSRRPGAYRVPAPLATRPSTPAGRKSSNQRRASAGSVVAGESCIGGLPALGQLLQRGAAAGQPLVAEVGAAGGEQVEGDVGRRVRGDQRRAIRAGGGDHPLLEQPEVQPRAVPDHDLAVEHGAGRHLCQRGGDDVREPVGQVAALLGPHPGRARRCGRRPAGSRPTWARTGSRRSSACAAGIVAHRLGQLHRHRPGELGRQARETGDGQRHPDSLLGRRRKRSTARRAVTRSSRTLGSWSRSGRRSSSSRLKAASEGPSVNRPSRDHRPQLGLGHERRPHVGLGGLAGGRARR